MARKASETANENISSDAMSAYLDRWCGLDDDAEKIMKAAMAECKNGPRADQKELKEEMQDAGVRMGAFKALLKVRKSIDAAKKKVRELEDDDRGQYQKMAEDFASDTIFGYMARKALDTAEFDAE